MENRNIRRKPSASSSRLPLTDAEGEVRELTRADAAEAVPFSALPEAERTMLEGIQLAARKRGPQKKPRKTAISIRLSPDVAEGLRATGTGWQRRADEALRLWLEQTRETVAK